MPIDGTAPQKIARRDEIIEATIRIVGRKGLAGASIRAIAHEVGFTMGVVTHHFRDKSELLCAALASCFSPWQALITEAGMIADPAQRLRFVMLSALVGEGRPAAKTQLWLGMLSQIDLDPQVADAYRLHYGQTRKDVVDILLECQKAGILAEGLLLEETAAHLLALGDGLLVSSLGEPERYTEDFIEKIMVAQIETLLRSRV